MIQTIYILWFQGFEHAPGLVKQCCLSWKHYNPDWNIILLDKSNLHEYVQLEDYIDLSGKNINFTALSDVVRLCLLRKHGGVWADATTFCNRPLNEWLPAYIKEGFFAFNRPKPGPKNIVRLLAPWFLYADKGSYIIEKWLDSTIRYFSIHDSPQDYYWVHFLFGDLCAADQAFKAIWSKVPKLPANGVGPHYIQEKGMFRTINETIQEDIRKKITPLYKLTYKCNFVKHDETLVLYYLYSTIRNQHVNEEK